MKIFMCIWLAVLTESIRAIHKKTKIEKEIDDDLQMDDPFKIDQDMESEQIMDKTKLGTIDTDDDTMGTGYIKSSSKNINFQQTEVDGKVVSNGNIDTEELDGTMKKEKNKKPVYKGNIKKGHSVFGTDTER